MNCQTAGSMLLKRRALLAALPLAGCGFRLRGAAALAFKSLFSEFAATSTLGREFNQSLAGAGVTVLTAPADRPRAEVVLDVLTDAREKSVASLSASGQVREFQLRVRLKFRLRTQAGRDLIDATEIVATRDISFNETTVLAKEAEELLLFKDMQSDVVQQLLRRLAAVRPG